MFAADILTAPPANVTPPAGPGTAVLVKGSRVAGLERTAEALRQTVDRGKMLGVGVTFRKEPEVVVIRGEGREKFPDFYDAVEKRVSAPLMILPSDATTIHVRVSAVSGALELHLPRKRLASSTTGIFILWMVGSALLLTTIAILFLRNQVRPIVQLARAAEQFGLGQDVQDFSPRGASEVRRAGRAFVVMADRLRRQVQSRTEMLAGISHDLRTPLTRMKLQLALLGDNAETRELEDDVTQMEHMIGEYLDFARAEGREAALSSNIRTLLKDIASDYARTGKSVTLVANDDATSTPPTATGSEPASDWAIAPSNSSRDVAA